MAAIALHAVLDQYDSDDGRSISSIEEEDLDVNHKTLPPAELSEELIDGIVKQVRPFPPFLAN